MSRHDAGSETAEPPATRRSVALVSSRVMTLGAVFVSLLVVPGILTSYFVVRGPPVGDSPETTLLGLVAMLPGFLMGATALWVAAHD